MDKLTDCLDELTTTVAEVKSEQPRNASFRVSTADRKAFLEAVHNLYPQATVERNPSSGVIARITSPTTPGNIHIYNDKIVISNGFAWDLVTAEGFANLVVKTW